jgi:hypothetical protein
MQKPLGPYLRSKSAIKTNNESEKARKLITFGSLRNPVEAFVYVGIRMDGIIKIGMSGRPHRRCRDLKISLLFTVPVVPVAAKLVETYALQGLGALVGDREWVKCSLDRAIDAVCTAWMAAGKIVHVNPLLTADQARAGRVAANQCANAALDS